MNDMMLDNTFFSDTFVGDRRAVLSAVGAYKDETVYVPAVTQRVLHRLHLLDTTGGVWFADGDDTTLIVLIGHDEFGPVYTMEHGVDCPEICE